MSERKDYEEENKKERRGVKENENSVLAKALSEVLYEKADLFIYSNDELDSGIVKNIIQEYLDNRKEV